ncbi:hypothetical protein VSU19_12650 [Verrucomicrobiales bacterium BCK34]|nr:hypothetical protein [Verrucomicrobiales bacterium BCK34]
MKKYSVEVVTAATFAAIVIQPSLISAQDRFEGTTTYSSMAASREVVSNNIAHRRSAIPGESLISGFEKPYVFSEKSLFPTPSVSPSASTLKLQSVEADEKALEARIQEKMATGNTPSTNGTVIRLGNDELFEGSSGRLSLRGQETLENVAAIINRHASPEVRVVANADSTLDKKQANAIRNYLARSSKITVDHVRIVRGIAGVSPEEARYTTHLQIVDRS